MYEHYMDYFNNKEQHFSTKRRQKMSIIRRKSIAKKAHGKIKSTMEALALQSLVYLYIIIYVIYILFFYSNKK